MTLEELKQDIIDNADVIYVRAQVDGKWGSFSLAELPGKIAIAHAFMLFERGIEPYKLKRKFVEDSIEQARRERG